MTDASGNEKASLSNGGVVSAQGLLSTKGDLNVNNTTNTVMASIISSTGIVNCKTLNILDGTNANVMTLLVVVLYL